MSTLPGYLYYAPVEKSVLNKLGEPFNHCDDNTDALTNPLAIEIKARGSKYSQNLCYNLCRNYYIEKACTCSLEYQLWTNGSDTCSTECVQPILDSFDFNENDMIYIFMSFGVRFSFLRRFVDCYEIDQGLNILLRYYSRKLQ